MLRIATRKSALALWQAEHVRSLLREPAELLAVTTQGDRILDRPLAEIGGKGLFVKELEQALLDGRADLAVHSAKDVPFQLPEGLELCAFPAREDPRDALVAPAAKTLANLPRGARVGTSSLRRSVQLLAARPDLVIVPVRGNVQTRISRAAGLDAVVLALAGLRRLGLESHVTEVLSTDICLPAPGQGALAIEVLRGSRGEKAAAPLDDPQTSICVRAERALLARLAAGCTLPVAAYAYWSGQQLRLTGALGGPDGNGGVKVIREDRSGQDPLALGREVAEALLEKGGGPLLEAAARRP
jgi:hydroxymethylbilane synthase